jgi:hypothetical protein
MRGQNGRTCGTNAQNEISFPGASGKSRRTMGQQYLSREKGSDGG